MIKSIIENDRKRPLLLKLLTLKTSFAAPAICRRNERVFWKGLEKSERGKVWKEENTEELNDKS